MSDTSFNTIIMDNSHDPKNDDGQASDVHPDVDSPVHILYVLWCTSDILYIPIEHIMYLILIINQNLILCDHDNIKINNKTEFSLKLVTNCQNSNF